MFFYEGTEFMPEEYFRAFPLTDPEFPMHFHRSYELIHVVDGEMNVTVDDKSYALGNGDLAFLFPDQLHSLRKKGTSQVTIIQFSPELIGHFSARCQKQIPTDPILHNLFYPADALQFENVYEKKAFLYRLCALLTQHTSFSPRDLRETPLFSLLSYISQNYQHACSLSLAAGKLGYDYAYLSRMFKQKTGISFTEYLNQFRISQAAYLLSNTSESISAVAFLCGYGTIRSFNRNFKTLTGTTPQKYRAQPADRLIFPSRTSFPARSAAHPPCDGDTGNTL